MNSTVVPFGTVQVVAEADAEGTEVTIQALSSEYTDEDWNAAATYARVLRAGLPPMHHGRTTELTSHTWHPALAPNVG